MSRIDYRLRCAIEEERANTLQARAEQAEAERNRLREALRELADAAAEVVPFSSAEKNRRFSNALIAARQTLSEPLDREKG